VRIEIDWTRCDGHGMCALLLPESVDSDADGFPVLHDPIVSAWAVKHARRAVAACPALALRLERT
jgi:ferredoxin